MRLIAVAACTAVTLTFTLLAPARGQTPASAAPARVEYVRVVNSPDARKLLGMGAGRLYLARKGGQVDVLDASQGGQLLFSLQPKDAEGRALLGQPEAVAVSPDTVYVVDSDENRVVNCCGSVPAIGFGAPFSRRAGLETATLPVSAASTRGGGLKVPSPGVRKPSSGGTVSFVSRAGWSGRSSTPVLKV